MTARDSEADHLSTRGGSTGHSGDPRAARGGPEVEDGTHSWGDSGRGGATGGSSLVGIHMEDGSTMHARLVVRLPRALA